MISHFNISRVIAAQRERIQCCYTGEPIGRLWNAFDRGLHDLDWQRFIDDPKNRNIVYGRKKVMQNAGDRSRKFREVLADAIRL